MGSRLVIAPMSPPHHHGPVPLSKQQSAGARKGHGKISFSFFKELIEEKILRYATEGSWAV